MVAPRTRRLSPRAGGRVSGHRGRSPAGRGCRQDLLPVLAGFSASPAGRNGAAGRATRPRPWVGAARAEPGSSSLCPEPPLSVPGGDRDTGQEPRFAPSETGGGGDKVGMPWGAEPGDAAPFWCQMPALLRPPPHHTDPAGRDPCAGAARVV